MVNYVKLKLKNRCLKSNTKLLRRNIDLAAEPD